VADLVIGELAGPVKGDGRTVIQGYLLPLLKVDAFDSLQLSVGNQRVVEFEDELNTAGVEASVTAVDVNGHGRIPHRRIR